jgi:uncharacterized protein (TIGR03067 family)
MHRPLFVLLMVSTAAVAAPVPKKVREKAPSLDGRWEIVEMRFLGQDITALNPWVWDIDGEKLTISNREKDGTLKLNDPTTATTLVRPENGEPGEVDYLRAGAGSNMLFKGRAKVDGDELVIGFTDPDKPRPAEVTTSTTYYHRFKRVK